tara:strand:+ start:9871 stop:12531 length:2661 start_codon:yes stop_codon:yes gene_type:complete
MVVQGTYLDSVCPYECTRKITRHTTLASNEANLFGARGLDGELLNYPGFADSRQGFSRFPFGLGIGVPVHALHMANNVTLDECDEIVRRHQLIAPHGLWMINKDLQNEPGLAAAERIGDCGLFLAARSTTDSKLWRAFYEYSRFVMRLGHFDAWLDTDIRAAAVHSSPEGECSGSTSKVCLWWSEFDLDQQEFSCRPNQEASNVVTPAQLLLALELGNVAYPPPNPPPPEPPSTPPPPFPPPGTLRCELSAIATTQGRKVPAHTSAAGSDAAAAAGEMFELVDQKCWRWDPGNNWPPFVAHRDVYAENDRCGGVASRDIQWGGGFSQSLMPRDAHDPAEQNNNDCPLYDMNARIDEADHIDPHNLLYTLKEGSHCFDQTGIKRTNQRLCDLGTNMNSCGVHESLVVFGFVSNYEIKPPASDDPVGNLHADSYCINRNTGRVIRWTTTAANKKCNDGGPGSVAPPDYNDELGTNYCYYGTHSSCGRRRFAFLQEDAGPDIPDDSCADTINTSPRFGANNGRCTHLQEPKPFACEPCAQQPLPVLRRRGRAHVELLRARRQPVQAEHGCAPRTRTTFDTSTPPDPATTPPKPGNVALSTFQVSDCGWRMPKRTTRIGVARSDTCDTTCEATGDCGTGCDDYTDEIALRNAPDGYDVGDDLKMATCGRGTQARRCQLKATENVQNEWSKQVDAYNTLRDSGPIHPQFSTPLSGPGGSAYNNHRYHERTIYVQAATIGQTTCTTPDNVLVSHPIWDFESWTLNSENEMPNTEDQWFKFLNTNDVASHVCSDGGEGSVRVPLSVPAQSFFGDSSYHAPGALYHYDYICAYGSQPNVCPPRDLSFFQETRDELEQPSGPAFSDCHNPNVADFECANAQFELNPALNSTWNCP